jgi:hypothetical protein
MTETFAVYPCSGDVPRVTSPGNGLGSLVWFSGWRGEGLGEEWCPGEGFGPFQRVLYLGGGLGAHGFKHRQLGSGAVHSGRHCEPCLWVWSVASVV